MKLRGRRALSRVLGRRAPDTSTALAASEKRIVVAAGMMRSGSTWLFNALRLLLERADEPVYAFWVHDYKPEAAAGARYLLAKLHEADTVLAAATWRCYTCHRDLRDVAVSLQDMGLAPDREGQLQLLQDAFEGYEFWSRRAALDIAYANLLADPSGVLAALSESLGTNLSAEALASIASELSTMRGDQVAHDAPYDPVTMMHREHRFDGRPGRYADSLDPETERRIVAAHGQWLQQHGYM